MTLGRRLILVCGVLASLGLPARGVEPDRIVLGYSAAWRDSVSPPKTFNYGALTHLARAFLTPHPDGGIEVPPAYFNPEMESLARQHHVKLLMSLGGEASNADNWTSISRHPEALDRFLGELDKLLTAGGYDGIDIDWEPAPLTNDDGLAYTNLLKAVRQRFPKAVVTTALPAGEYWVSHFSWPDVYNNVDYVNAMTYDYSGAWGGVAGHASNLYAAGAYPPHPGNSADEGMRNLLQHHHVPAAKVLMGITFWGKQFAVDKIGDHFPTNSPGCCSDLDYPEILALLNGGAYHEFWDDKAAMPYLQRTGGGVVCYENPRSITAKCDYALKIGCAGVMIWHVGADWAGGQAPLMDALAASCLKK